MRKLVTTCDFPPIPDRRFDWRAYIDGDEESGKYGYGQTEAEAIADFAETWGEEYEAEDAAQREREAEALHNGGLSPLGQALAILSLEENGS
jgi:hypothetical protein